MPSITPPLSSVTAPYDSLNSILNTVRTRMNDAIASIGGDILTNDQPYTQQNANDGWRNLQAEIANLGFSKYKRKFWGYGLPIVASTDPSSETQWTWSYFFDGTSYYAPPECSVLPADFICPLKMKERQTGTNQPFILMQMAPDGLPECRKTPYNRCFEWKNDAIYMPGSTYSMDLEVEYAAYDADFVNQGDPTDGGVYWYNLPVPIMRCRSALANFICAEAAGARGDMDAQAFLDAARRDTKLLFNNSDVKLKQRTPVSRRPYGRGSSWQLNGNSGY